MSEVKKYFNVAGREIIADNPTLEAFARRYEKFYSNKPKFSTADGHEAWLRKLLEIRETPFTIWLHRTNVDFDSILGQGLRIYEEGGDLNSTMSMVFSSEHPNIEECINYFLNSLILLKSSSL